MTAGADALAAARDAAEARLRDARRRLGEADLGAPFAGVVTEVHFEPGEFVPAGRPVVVLAGGDALEVEMRLPESVITQIEPGDRVVGFMPNMSETVVAMGGRGGTVL